VQGGRQKGEKRQEGEKEEEKEGKWKMKGGEGDKD
jgi:hypothetical protein